MLPIIIDLTASQEDPSENGSTPTLAPPLRPTQRPLPSLIREGTDEDEQQWPRWLKPLLRERFFSRCKLHANSHKSSECNKYCLDCVDGALCSICLSGHKDHSAIQIRKNTYYDVIRISEIPQILDISSVQPYVINYAKVVFLNERPHEQRRGKGGTDMCEVCERRLIDNFRFCSLGCMVVGASRGVARIYSTDSMRASSSSSSFRTAKRKRKGIPHRAPTGGIW